MKKIILFFGLISCAFAMENDDYKETTRNQMWSSYITIEKQRREKNVIEVLNLGLKGCFDSVHSFAKNFTDCFFKGCQRQEAEREKFITEEIGDKIAKDDSLFEGVLVKKDKANGCKVNEKGVQLNEFFIPFKSYIVQSFAQEQFRHLAQTCDEAFSEILKKDGEIMNLAYNSLKMLYNSNEPENPKNALITVINLILDTKKAFSNKPDGNLVVKAYYKKLKESVIRQLNFDLEYVYNVWKCNEAVVLDRDQLRILSSCFYDIFAYLVGEKKYITDIMLSNYATEKLEDSINGLKGGKINSANFLLEDKHCNIIALFCKKYNRDPSKLPFKPKGGYKNFQSFYDALFNKKEKQEQIAIVQESCLKQLLNIDIQQSPEDNNEVILEKQLQTQSNQSEQVVDKTILEKQLQTQLNQQLVIVQENCLEKSLNIDAQQHQQANNETMLTKQLQTQLNQQEEVKQQKDLTALYKVHKASKKQFQQQTSAEIISNFSIQYPDAKQYKGINLEIFGNFVNRIKASSRQNISISYEAMKSLRKLTNKQQKIFLNAIIALGNQDNIAWYTQKILHSGEMHIPDYTLEKAKQLKNEAELKIGMKHDTDMDYWWRLLFTYEGRIITIKDIATHW